MDDGQSFPIVPDDAAFNRNETAFWEIARQIRHLPLHYCTIEVHVLLGRRPWLGSARRGKARTIGLTWVGDGSRKDEG